MYNLKTVMEQLIIRLFAIFLVAILLAVSPVALAEDSTILQFWGVVGTWVAGVSTFLAVVVSLWLALRQAKIRLQVSAQMAIGGFPGGARHFCLIEVVNDGSKPAKITSLMWKGPKGKGSIVPRDIVSGRGKFPEMLNDGEIYHLMIEEDEMAWMATAFAGMGCKKRHIKQLKIRVATSNGQEFIEKARRDVIEKILAFYK